MRFHRDPVAQTRISEVDPREGADLTVEDDREVLREVWIVRLSREIRALLPSLRELPRDVVELVATLVGKAEEHDGLVVLAEVLARLVGLQVLTGELRTGSSALFGWNL